MLALTVGCSVLLDPEDHRKVLPDGGDGGVDGARADGSSPDADSVDAGVRDGGLPGSCDTSESPAAPCSPNTPTTLVPLNLGASYLARVSAAVTLARGQPQLVVGVVEDAGPTREAALISTAFDDQFATVGRFSLTGAIELASGVRPSAASSFAVARSAPGTVAYTLLGDDPPGAPTGIWVGRVEYAAVDPAATATNLAGGDPADVLGEAAAVGGRDGLFAGARHFWREATLSDPPALAALPASDVGMAAFRATNQGVPAESEAVRVASTEGGLVFMRAPTAGDLLAWSGWGTGPGAAGEPNTLNAATAPEVLTVAGGGVRLVGFDAAWLAGEDYAIATIEDGGGAPEVRVRIASCSQRCGAADMECTLTCSVGASTVVASPSAVGEVRVAVGRAGEEALAVLVAEAEQGRLFIFQRNATDLDASPPGGFDLGGFVGTTVDVGLAADVADARLRLGYVVLSRDGVVPDVLSGGFWDTCLCRR